MNPVLSATLLLTAVMPLQAAQTESASSALAGYPGQEIAGTLVFHGRYKHWNTGREIQQPSKLWLKQTEDGALTAIAEVPFMNSTEFAAAGPTGRFASYRTFSPASGNHPAYEMKLAFSEGKVRATRRGWKDWEDKELAVPTAALFDPNTRPDSYCAANILLRAFRVEAGEKKQFQVFDLNNSGEAFVGYTIQVQQVGKERVDVPAGSFEATHVVLTQVTSADTWFKKRAGHITDFWVLDNHVVVRIRRHREPYEVSLLDYSVPAQLPGQISGPEPTAREPGTDGQSAAGFDSRYTFEADWTAFAREVDQTYPFFELKGIRQDWAQTKARLLERVKACASASEFLGVVTEAIRCLRDSHMGITQAKVSLPPWPRRYYPGISFMPATANRVIVMTTDPHTGVLEPGTVVTKIDGHDARTVLEEKANQAWSTESPYLVSFSSPQRARLFAYRWPLLELTNRTHKLHCLVDGRERELDVTCAIEPRGWPHTYNMPANLSRMNSALTHTQLPSGAGYIHLRTVGDETAGALRGAFSAHPNAKGWVVDLRGNGGGGYDTNLLAAISDLPRPVVALIDAGCISAGETLARDLAHYAGARLLGSRTAGASSSKRDWQFPSGIASVTFSTRSRWRGDGQPIEFNGIVPDEELEAVPEEVARGINSEILRAEEYLAKLVAATNGASTVKPATK